VVIVTERFRELADAIRRSRNMPDAPCVVLPPTEETEYGNKEAMERVADQALRAVLAIVAPGARRTGA
jgi:hypothetical protein